MEFYGHLETLLWILIEKLCRCNEIIVNYITGDPAMHVRQKKTATSEPKLFKTNVFSRQKAMRHTFRFNKQDSGSREIYGTFLVNSK